CKDLMALAKPASAPDQSSARKRSTACLAGPFWKKGCSQSWSKGTGLPALAASGLDAAGVVSLSSTSPGDAWALAAASDRAARTRPVLSTWPDYEPERRAAKKPACGSARLIHRDPVPPAVLALVERLVGVRDQVGGVLHGRVGHPRHADADRDRDVRPFVHESVLFDRLAHPLGHHVRLSGVDPATDDRELLAAVAR